MPILPDLDTNVMQTLAWQKDFIWAYLTAHYSKIYSVLVKYLIPGPLGLGTQNKTVNVPWVSIKQDLATFIDARYLPKNVTLGEPSDRKSVV